MGNTFGRLFRVTSWGESHGAGIGVVIDGCPARLAISEEELQAELNRRRPGQSEIVSSRNEKDQVRFLSGVKDGVTLGTPLAMMVYNGDAKPEEYSDIAKKYRPSHADYTYDAKYGVRDASGGGRASARETVARVMAGAVARKILEESSGVEIRAYVEQIGTIRCPEIEVFPSIAEIEATPVRCPHGATAEQMVRLIQEVKEAGDSLGGVVRCCIRNVPAGLGEPVFDRLEADLAKGMLSIPATKGFEIGSGFAGVSMRGSEHNDKFVMKSGRMGTETNFSGGIQGGISNGEDIYFRVAFKPTSTIQMPQKTVDSEGNTADIEVKGRHDPCVVPRAVPIVESMASLVLADHFLLQKTQASPVTV